MTPPSSPSAPATRPVDPGQPEPPPGVPAEGEGATSALPVAVAVEGRPGDELRRHVEGVLGWQAVDGDTAALVPPALRLVGPDSPPAPHAAAPTLLLVADDLPPGEAAHAGTEHGPAAILAWPSQRDRLPDVAARLLAAPRPARAATETLRVAGAGGGVGTSTVALALAGVAAWLGTRVLVVVGTGAPCGQVRTVPPDALTAHDLWRRASPLPAVPAARVVRISAPAPPTGLEDLRAAGAELVVVDAGRQPEPDVLVCRPDRVGREALAATSVGAVVCNGGGPLTPRTLLRAAPGRVRVELPASSRVARAGLHARVPGSLPGAWLRRLRPVLGPWSAAPAAPTASVTTARRRLGRRP